MDECDEEFFNDVYEDDSCSLFRSIGFCASGWEKAELIPGLAPMTRTEFLAAVYPVISAEHAKQNPDEPHREFAGSYMTYECHGEKVTRQMMEKLGVADDMLHWISMNNSSGNRIGEFKRILVEPNMTQRIYGDLATPTEPLSLLLIEHKEYNRSPLLNRDALEEISLSLAFPHSMGIQQSLGTPDDLMNAYSGVPYENLVMANSFYVLNATPSHTLVANANGAPSKEYLDSLMEQFRLEFPDEKELLNRPCFYDAKAHELTKDGGILKERFAEPKMEAEQQAQEQENPAPRRRGR